MSQIRNELRQLCELQNVDLEISERTASLQQVEDKLGKTGELEDSRHGLAEAQQKLAGLKKAQADLESEVQEMDAKLKKLDAALYAGGKGSKELTAIQKEIETAKAHRQALDEKALDLLGQVDAGQSEVDSRSSALETLEKEWAAQQESLKRTQRELKADLKALQKEREKARAPISDTVLSVYESVRAVRGQAVARVERGMCKGCRLILPVSQWQRVRSGALVQCGSCGRILCLD